VIAIWMLRTGRAAPPEGSAERQEVEQEQATA